MFSAFDIGGLIVGIGLTITSAIGLSAAIMLLRPWPIAVFVGLFSALFVAIGVFVIIDMLFWNSLIISGPVDLTIQSGILGFRRSVSAPRDESTRLECQLDFRKGNGEWWCIYLRPPDTVIETVDGVVVERYVTAIEAADESDELDIVPAPPLKIVKRLDGRVEAESIQVWLAKQLGITANKSTPKSGLKGGIA